MYHKAIETTLRKGGFEKKNFLKLTGYTSTDIKAKKIISLDHE